MATQLTRRSKDAGLVARTSECLRDPRALDGERLAASVRAPERALSERAQSGSMEVVLVVLFAPAALIAASAVGLSQFLALWRAFAAAASTRSGSQAWKTVQPGACQCSLPRTCQCALQWQHASARSMPLTAQLACDSAQANQRRVRELTWRNRKHHQDEPDARPSRGCSSCSPDFWRTCALRFAQAIAAVQFESGDDDDA